MTVSMAALLTLSWYAFLLGGARVLFFLLVRAAFRLFLPLPPDFPSTLRARLPAHLPVPRISCRFLFRILRDFFDLFAVLLSSITVIILLYWKGDGVPRMFVPVACGLGALLFHRLIRRPFRLVEVGFQFALRYCFGILLVPPLLFLFHSGKRFLSFLQNIVCLFIKFGKRHYTNLVSARYEKRAAQRLAASRVRAALVSAMKEGET